MRADTSPSEGGVSRTNLTVDAMNQPMNYTLRPKGISPSGGLAVFARTAREAVEQMDRMLRVGAGEVQVSDASGMVVEESELRRLAGETTD